MIELVRRTDEIRMVRAELVVELLGMRFVDALPKSPASIDGFLNILRCRGSARSLYRKPLPDSHKQYNVPVGGDCECS